MKLLRSISGIRGVVEKSKIKYINKDSYLSKYIIENIITAFYIWIKNQDFDYNIIIGRDPRISGVKISNIIKNVLFKHNIHPIDIGISTTPTLALASKNLNIPCIMITASHNPIEWNGIKILVNGRNLYQNEWEKIFEIEKRLKENSEINQINYTDKIKKNNISNATLLDQHIYTIKNCELIDYALIKKKRLKIGIDAVNIQNLFPIKKLLQQLGTDSFIHEYKNNKNTNFGRNPEPIAKNLKQFSSFIVSNNLDIGFAYDPDCDRVAILDENGNCIGEEFTLILCADYVLSKKKGDFVTNLSSSLLNKKIAKKHGVNFYQTKVGESNVLRKLIKEDAMIGGEGNGGLIFPSINQCRDGLLATAIILSMLAENNKKLSSILSTYPKTYFKKENTSIDQKINIDKMIENFVHEISNNKIFKNQEIQINKEDGVKLEFANGWILIRKSNTEPIIRVFGETIKLNILDSLFDTLTIKNS